MRAARYQNGEKWALTKRKSKKDQISIHPALTCIPITWWYGGFVFATNLGWARDRDMAGTCKLCRHPEITTPRTRKRSFILEVFFYFSSWVLAECTAQFIGAN